MGGFKFIPKKTGLAAILEEQEAARRAMAALEVKPKSPQQEAREKAGYVEPEHAEDRIKIIFDDSGSMQGQKIKDARQGCIEFLRYCNINKVAVGIYPMNEEPIALDTNLPELAALIEHIQATDYTPMFETLVKAQTEEIKATRYIVFSDGQPDSTNLMSQVIEKAQGQKTPIDTVYISNGGRDDNFIMKDLADRTGGIYLIFDRNKVNFGSAFKYLAPGQRLQLMSASFRQDLEEGRIK